MKATVPITTRSAPAPTASQHRLDGAQAAAELDRHAGARGDALEVLEVHRAPVARAVEVHDVQPRRALGDPAPRGLERVGVVDLAALEVALLEPHRLAAEDVDRRDRARALVPYDVAPTAAQIDVKLRSSCRPCALDFSGWNCTP